MITLVYFEAISFLSPSHVCILVRHTHSIRSCGHYPLTGSESCESANQSCHLAFYFLLLLLLFPGMADLRLKCIAEEWIARAPRTAVAAVRARPTLVADYLASLRGAVAGGGRLVGEAVSVTAKTTLLAPAFLHNPAELLKEI